ncbi:uncharacterized protein BX664DRAFT_349299 [Halteromyces radiatus]|uniref:uncharacterized protein n=1 Tax=Halteromyces radiatus TaxID=101107 RepID=UPI00221F839E|nr:uncharacterized protein BX664DRAFT_349299 [Halteromyces radiatus]KAI8088859.1 hypothetical protein BX664DRAFT_349299 [Halteromyces radiatus]
MSSFPYLPTSSSSSSIASSASSVSALSASLRSRPLSDHPQRSLFNYVVMHQKNDTKLNSPEFLLNHEKQSERPKKEGAKPTQHGPMAETILMGQFL